MSGNQIIAGPYSRRLRQLHLAMIALVMILLVSGAIFHFRRSIGLADSKILIMFAHALIGYGLIGVVILRAALSVWGAEGDALKHVLISPRHVTRLMPMDGKPVTGLKFAGRSPLSRLIATMVYLLLAANMMTGLVFATTDLYFPPFGGALIEYVAADGVTPSIEAVRSGAFDPARMKAVRDFKRPFGEMHLIGAIAIGALISVHAVGVIMTEWSALNDKTAYGRARLMLFGPRKTK